MAISPHELCARLKLISSKIAYLPYIPNVKWNDKNREKVEQTLMEVVDLIDELVVAVKEKE